MKQAGGAESPNKVSAERMAPHTGHVSNSCGPVGEVIEPVDAYCFQTDSCEPLTCVHAGHPVWIRLELTREPRITSACAVIWELVASGQKHRSLRRAAGMIGFKCFQSLTNST